MAECGADDEFGVPFDDELSEHSASDYCPWCGKAPLQVSRSPGGNDKKIWCRFCAYQVEL